MPNRNQMSNLHISEIQLIFLVSFTIEHKVGIVEFYLYMAFGGDLLSSKPENCRNRNTHTSKIGKLLPVWLSKIDVEGTTFLSCMQNLVKIGKELWTQYLIETKSEIFTSLKSIFYFWFHSPLNTKSALLNFIITWDLVLICWKCGQQSLKTAEIGIHNPHTSKIGKLLPVCLTNTA